MARKSRTPDAPEPTSAHRSAPCDEAPLAEEGRWRMVRVVYPLNPGIPHYLDFPGARKG